MPVDDSPKIVFYPIRGSEQKVPVNVRKQGPANPQTDEKPDIKSKRAGSTHQGLVHGLHDHARNCYLEHQGDKRTKQRH